MNIAEALRTGMGLGLDRLEAQLLLLHSLNRPADDRAWLLAHDTDEVAEATWQIFEVTARRRRSGEPLAYITGHQEFYGLNLQVDRRVLVPRADTETLVDWALDLLANRPVARVLDLGTGSGAIALALKHQRPEWLLSALDASQDALTVAQANAQRLKLDVTFNHSHWLEGQQGQFDAIVSNPPYIASDDPHLPSLAHEPVQALTSGVDGLDDLRTIIAQAPAHLQNGGWLLLEHGYNQAPAVRDLLVTAGFKSVKSVCDLAGIERCSGGQV